MSSEDICLSFDSSKHLEPSKSGSGQTEIPLWDLSNDIHYDIHTCDINKKGICKCKCVINLPDSGDILDCSDQYEYNIVYWSWKKAGHHELCKRWRCENSRRCSPDTDVLQVIASRLKYCYLTVRNISVDKKNESLIRNKLSLFEKDCWNTDILKINFSNYTDSPFLQVEGLHVCFDEDYEHITNDSFCKCVCKNWKVFKNSKYIKKYPNQPLLQWNWINSGHKDDCEKEYENEIEDDPDYLLNYECYSCYPTDILQLIFLTPDIVGSIYINIIVSKEDENDIKNFLLKHKPKCWTTDL